MNKALILGVILALSLMTFASASRVDIHGLVYRAGNISNGVSGAFVNVSCGSNVVSDVSGSAGEYFVSLPSAENCAVGSNFTVYASDGIVSNSVTKEIKSDTDILGVDIPLLDGIGIGYVSLPMVPEFGFLAGSAAIVGALALFFFVRRK